MVESSQYCKETEGLCLVMGIPTLESVKGHLNIFQVILISFQAYFNVIIRRLT